LYELIYGNFNMGWRSLGMVCWEWRYSYCSWIRFSWYAYKEGKISSTWITGTQWQKQ